MSVQQVQKDYASQLVVRLLDASGDPVLGVAFSALTVTYKKQGDGSWSSKTVLTTDWQAGPNGRYFLLFSGSELSRDGRFHFRVAASGADTFTGDVDVVEDWATVEAMLVSLINGLSGKVTTASVKAYKQTQDQAIQDTNNRVGNLEEDFIRVERMIAAIHRKINA